MSLPSLYVAPNRPDQVDVLVSGNVYSTQSWHSIGSVMRVALIAVLVLVFGIGTFGLNTVLSGAVTTSGRLEVQSKIKKVQPSSGGVVAAILARDGDRVEADQVLIRLDETIARSNLAILTKGLTQQNARLTRLVTERDGLEQLSFPNNLQSRRNLPEVEEALRTEERQFEARKIARDGQRSQLDERIKQSMGNIDGLSAQIVSKDREIQLIEQELIGVRELFARKLVQLGRVNQLERDDARLKGERGALISSIASEKGRIAEIQLQILSIDQQLRQEVTKDIRDTQAQIAELEERAVAAADTLQRLEIRAPQTGVVNQSVVHTVGGVIQQGEQLMLIVPEHDALVAEVQISPADIDRLYPGQPATIRLTAFDRTTTPELNATLSYIAADLTKEERTGATYYPARISIPDEERERLGDLKLVPGMPVEAYIRTNDRTILSYLTKPIFDQMRRAFRE